MARFAFKSLSPRKLICSTYFGRDFAPNYGVVFREISHPRMYDTLFELLYEAFFSYTLPKGPKPRVDSRGRAAYSSYKGNTGNITPRSIQSAPMIPPYSKY